jgi:uncharacterized protein (TIGR04562 family)
MRVRSRGDDALGVSRDALRSIVSGRSALDHRRLHVVSPTDAEAFLRCYGFEWNEASHRRELEEIRDTALHFLETELLPPELSVLPEVREMTDVRRLLVWASEDGITPRRRWSCALLRVMHTCAHASSYADVEFGQSVRELIRARFEPHIHVVKGVPTLGRGDAAIELVSFELRPPKTFEAVMIKLLCAAQNVAAEIYDRQGVRIVTRGKLDAFLVVHHLRVNNVIMFANIQPTRSRNTLLDPDWYDAKMAELGQDASTSSRRELVERLRQLAETHAPDNKSTDHNVFSDAEYRSIQFTCREMIRVPATESRPGGRFFFPYEVQVLDEASWRHATTGDASHIAYRARQLDAARRRVLRGLLPKVVVPQDEAG